MTRDELERYKESWEADPWWNLEEGFEDTLHYEELLAHRLAKEQQWAEEDSHALKKLAEQFGLDGNLKFATALRRLLQRLDKLEIAVMGED